MSLTSSSRCVLVMSDEGLQVYNVGRFGIKHIEFLTWDVPDFKESLKTLLIKKCNRNPVVILNDMVEQHYRRERIPKTNIGDKAGVIKSRLNFVFQSNQIRSALKLNKKNNPAAEGAANTGDPYLFAAVPKSNQFTKTFDTVLASGCKLVGFYLLPVEGVNMISDLSKKLNKGNKVKSVWTIFIGQQSNGGLRQIVTRNDELALTRMTPIVDTDIEPALWAREVVEELDATMSYLTRFGYKKEDGLDIYIIANGSTHEVLQQNINVEADLRLMTALDAASNLSVKIGSPTDLRYTDLLYASYLGNRKKFLLPMQSQSIEKVTRPGKIANFVVIGLLAALAYVGFTSFQNWQKSIVLKDSLSVTEQQFKTQEQEYKSQVEKKKALGFDLAKVDGALDSYREIEKEKINVLRVLQEVGLSLGNDLVLEKLLISPTPALKVVDRTGYADPSLQPSKKMVLEGLLTLSFPSTIDPEVGVKEVDALVLRLSQNLSNYNIEVLKQVADLSYTGNVTGQSGENESGNPVDFKAEIRILEKQ